MTLFLTSSPCIQGSIELNPENGFVDRLMQAMPRPAHGLFISSYPEDIEGMEHWALEMKGTIADAGANFLTFHVLHGGTASRAEQMVRHSNFIILAGGHVPTQNNFFHQIHLRELLKNYSGVIMGISAGSMNSAHSVYAMPEEEGEAVDPFYHRFLEGLSLTETMIIPHFQKLRDGMLDGQRLIEDIALKDSIGHRFYAMPDGSYLYRRGSREELHGPAWVIHNGNIRIANHPGEVLLLHE